MLTKLLFRGNVTKKVDPEGWRRGQGIKSCRGRVKGFATKTKNKGKDKGSGVKWLKSAIWEFWER